jgi:hypothetical protein
LPTTTFPRKTLPEVPEAINNPLAFPMMVLASTTLSVSTGLGRPIPKFDPCVAYPFPLIRFARSRLPLEPASHMPPQADTPLPLRIDMLS